MKTRFFILALVMVMAVCKIFAQNDGIYRMVQLKPEKAKKWTPYPWVGRLVQYKVCFTENDNKVLLHFTIDGNMNNQNVHFTVFRDLPVSSGEPKALQEVQIFDITENSFKEKWFSNYTKHNYFASNAWMIEQWEKVDMSHALDDENIIHLVRLMLDFRKGDFKNSSWGIKGFWERKGFMWTNDSVKTNFVPDNRPQDYFKIYLGDFMMTLHAPKGKFLDTRKENIEGWYGKVEYISKDLNREWNSKNPVIIEFTGKDTMHNIFIDSNGNTIREVWERMK